MAKTKYGSLKFPFEDDPIQQSLKRTTTVNDTIGSAIKSYLITRPGQRRGNHIGSFLPDLKHHLIQSTALSGLSDELKTDLVNQFPKVIFLEVTLSQSYEDKVSNLHVKIRFSTSYSDVEELLVVI